jgi:hypothetical protein
MHRVNGKRIMFRGDRKVIPSCMTSIMTVRKLIKKGCPVYLAYVRGKRKMFRGDRKVILIYTTSIMTVKKLIKKGYLVYLTYVR